MVLLLSAAEGQKLIGQNIRKRRIQLDLSQESLALRSGVALSTLRKFEQKGTISLGSLVKLLFVVGGLEEVIEALKPARPAFNSIDEVLNENRKKEKKYGRKK